MQIIGECAALLAAVLWSGTAVVFAEASKRVGAETVNISRLLFALILLFLTICIMGTRFSISSRQMFYLALSGLVGLVFGDTFLFKAFSAMGTRLSMLFMSLAPAMSAILGYFMLKEVLSVLAIAGMILTVCGVALVAAKGSYNSEGKKINPAGIIFGLLGALGQGAGLIFAKLAFREGQLDGFLATFYRILPSVIVFIPMARLLMGLPNPWKKYGKDKRALLLTLIGSIIGPYLGITLSLIAIRYVYVGIASALTSTVPVIMLPISRYYYKERLSPVSIIGAIIAVIGVIMLI